MAQTKFGLNYVLAVETQNGETLVIEPPFTLDFDVSRNTLSSTNIAALRIYNLSQNNRNQLRYDFSNYGTLRTVILRAGYGLNLPVIFAGNITQAYSVREGSSMVTTIEAFDGGFAFVNATTQSPFPSGTSMETIFRSLIGDLKGISYGAISSNFLRDPNTGEEYRIPRGNTYNGSTVDILTELSGGGFYVDNGKAFILGNSAALAGGITAVDASTGLLGTPQREETIVNIDMIFEPRLLVGQKINLQSLTADFNVNGIYKIISVKHRGTISESVAGDTITSAGFFYGTQSLEILEVG